MTSSSEKPTPTFNEYFYPMRERWYKRLARYWWTIPTFIVGMMVSFAFSLTEEQDPSARVAKLREQCNDKCDDYYRLPSSWRHCTVVCNSWDPNTVILGNPDEFNAEWLRWSPNDQELCTERDEVCMDPRTLDACMYYCENNQEE